MAEKMHSCCLCYAKYQTINTKNYKMGENRAGRESNGISKTEFIRK